jgi:hypothetical protein
VLCIPFGLSVLQFTPAAPFFTSGLLQQIALAGGGYPYLTVNAYNAWAVVPSNLGISLAGSGQWVCDTLSTPADRCGTGYVQFGSVPAIVVGAVLLIVVILTALWAIWRNPDRLTITVGLAVIALAFFMAPTRVHERYDFPFFAIAALLFAISPRWRVLYVVLSIATFANMYVVPTTIYPPTDPTNPIRDWLGIGPGIRSQAGVTGDRRHVHARLDMGMAPASAVGAGAARGGGLRLGARPSPPPPMTVLVRRRPAGRSGRSDGPGGPRCRPRCRHAADMVRTCAVRGGRDQRLDLRSAARPTGPCRSKQGRW